MNTNCSYIYKSKTYSTDRLKRILIEELPIRNQEKSIEFLQEYLGMTRDEVIIVKGLIDNRSLGRFIQDGRILLSEFAELPVAQHEAFHRVWRLYLSNDERIQAINAFKKNKNWKDSISKYEKIYPNLTENELIEEYFADEFSDFMSSPETYKLAQPIKSFFQRLLDFIKKLVGLKVQDVATIYQRIYNKEFANANKSLSPYLGDADAIIIQDHPFTVEQKHEIVNKLTQQFVKTMIQQNGDVEQFLTGGTSKIKDIIKYVSGQIGKQILDSTDQQTAIAYIKDVNGYLTQGQESEFVNSLKKNLQLIGLKINDVEDTTEGSLDNEIKATREFSDSVEFDPSSTMSSKIKFLLSSFDEQIDTPNYRFKQPVSYKKAFIQIATRMVGVPTSEFMSELEKLNLSYIKDLVDLISKSPQFRNEFIRTMALTQNNFQIMNIEADKKSNKTDIYFMDANSGTRENKVTKEWQGNLIKKIETEGYDNWAGKLRQLKQKSFNTPLDVLLEHFGIVLNSEVGGYKDLAYSIVDTATKQIDKPTFNLELSKPFSRENLDIQGFVEKLAKKQAVYEDQVDLMVNISGKKLYSLGLNTQQTQVINGIAYAQRQFTSDMSLEQKIEILRKYAPFVVSEFNLTKTDKGYKILNKWLSKILNGERLTLNIIYAVKTATGETSEISKLGEPDLMAMHLNGTLQGLTTSMKHADRSTFYAYQFGTKPLFGKAVTPNVEASLDLLTDVYVEQILLEAKLQNKFKNDPTSVQYINKNFAKPVFGSILGDAFNDVVETGKVKDKQKIYDYIEKQFNQYKKDVGDYGLLYKNAGLNNTLLVDYGSVDNMLAAAFVNEVSNHIYESRLFSGDARVFKNGNDLFKRLSPQSSTGNLPVTDKFTEEYVKQELNRDELIINPLTGESAVINTANQMVDGMFRAVTLAEKEDYVSHLLDKSGIISQLTGQEESKLFLMLEDNYRKDGLLETDAQKRQYIKKFRLYEEKYSGINENDGQSYMTLPAFKNYMIRQGLWTDGMELVYQTEMKIANLKSLKDAANLEIEHKGVKFKPFVLEGKDKFKERTVDGKTIKMDAMHTLKTQFAGYSVPENYFKAKEEMEFMFNSVYKTSQHLLLPSAIIGTNLQLMNFSLLSNSIDIAHMGSANKVGGVDPKQAAKIAKANGRTSELLDDIENRGLDFYDTKGFFNHSALTENADILTYLSDWNNLKDQVKIGNKVKSEIKGSTQSLKILLSNMINRGVPRFEGAQELVDKYKKVVRELVQTNQQNTLEELGYNLDTSEFTSLDQLKKVVLESGQIAEAPDNIKNSVENFFNDTDLGLEALPMKNKIENVLYALISNGIISFDRPGTSYPQAAITGYEKLGTRDTTRSNQDTLKFYDPVFDGQGNVTSVKPAEIIIPLPDYWIKPMLKKFKTNNIVLALEMLNEDIKVRPELYQVKGLRIPNQQLSSNDFFQIQKFNLPTMQNYVLVPSEIVIKVGSDFDIDKLNIYWAEDTELKIFGDLSDEEIQDKYDNHVENSKEQGLEPIPFEIFKKKYQTSDSKDRELLSLEKQILLNPRNAHHLVMPLTDEIFVKDIYAQMVKEGLITPPEPSYLASYLPTTNVKNAVIFVQGKFAVGIGALGITNKATSQADSVEINRFYYPGGATPLEKQLIKPNSLKLLFKGLEDNYYLSDYTDNLGTIISETQSQLLTQFVDNVKNPTAVLMGITMQTANVMDYLVRRGVNPQSIIYLINQPLVKLYLAYQKSNESYFNKANNLELSKNELTKELLKNSKYEVETLPETELDFSLVDSEMKDNLLNPKYNEQQLQMLSYFLDLQDQSRAFSDLNASQNSDTKPLKDKQALGETGEIYRRVMKTGIVSVEMFSKMNTQGLVAPFYQFGRKMYNIYSPFYVIDTSYFGSLLYDFKNKASNLEKGAGKDRVRQTIENDFVLFLVQNFNMTNEFDKLMVGNNSVARRIQELKIKLPSNLVLKQFVPMLNNVVDPETGNKVDNIRLFEKELTGFDSQDLAESLKEIAETDVELYKDLVKVLMYQSGLNISPFNYRQIITIGLDTLRDKLSDYEFFYQDLVGNGVKNGLAGLTEPKAKKLFEQFVTLFGANNPQFLKKNFFHTENPYSLKKVWVPSDKKFVLRDRKEKPHPQLGTGSTKKYHLASTTKNTVPPEVTKQPNYDNVGDYVDYEDVTDAPQEQLALPSGISNLTTPDTIQPDAIKFIRKDSKNSQGYYEEFSNFTASSVKIVDEMDIKYPNVENYYQASKSLDKAERLKFVNISAYSAKQLGKSIKLRSDWDNVKYDVMRKGLSQKFSDPKFMQILQSTKGKQIIEWTWWGDKIWGMNLQSQGNNALGKLLMELRDGLPSGTVEQPVASDNTITYTPIGKTQQVYTIEGNRILNRDGREVFKEDSKDRNKIFANFAIKQKKAVVVEHKGSKYVVNQKDQIVSVTTGDIMKWTEENGNRKAILELAKEKFNVKQEPKIENVVQTETAATLTKYELFPGVFANQGQTEALDLIGDFLDSSKSAFTLVGRGGTGKTTIIKKIVAEQKKKGKKVLGITVAHKAKKVLGKSIGKDIVKTVASALAIKLDENTGNFVPDTYAREQGRVPIKSADIIIVDEASMISPGINQEIMTLKKSGAKVIFMGDNAQLPPVGEQVDSPVFDLKDKYVLLEKMRQAKTSPIINTGTVVAENIESDSPQLTAIKDRISKYDEISKSGVVFIKDENQALDAFVEDFRRSGGVDPDYVKAVTFNNERHNASQSVKNLNDKIRLKLWGEASKEQFVPGELVTAYSTYSRDSGGDENEIPAHNSDDFIVTDVEYRNSQQGFVTAYSNKDGTRKFNYKYDIVILSLLNSDGKPIIGYSVPVIANSSKLQYEQDVAKLWKTDKGLAFALTNEFANIQYGYAITSHKAQGSTYRSTYVFEDNILGPTNGGDIITKNKSLYVAVSRPTTKLVMISDKNTNPIEDINFDNSTSRYTPSLLMYQDFIKKNQLYTGEEVLPFIGESEYYRYLVPMLLKMNPEVKTLFSKDLESSLVEQVVKNSVPLDSAKQIITDFTSTRDLSKVTGFSVKELNTNFIKKEARVKTVVHELVHSTLQKEYEKGTEFKRKIDELYGYAWDRQKDDVAYGFRSPKEFLAEALSNPEFMQELNEIPYKEETVFSYLMRLVSDFINELLGVELNSGSVLAEVINLSEQVLQKNVGEISKNTPVELSSMGQEIIANFESYFPEYSWMNDTQKYQTAKLVEQGKLTLNCKF